MYLVLPLRQKVLRPHQSITEVGFAGDANGTHFAAFDDLSSIVGVVSLVSDPATDSTTTWRLRGMAADPDRQGRGIGRALMIGVLDFVARAGGGKIWCHARLHAVGFYERFGFVTTGASFEEPEIGPHVLMERTVNAIDNEPSPI